MDLEFLTSRWTTESHTCVTVWGEFCPTLENAAMLTDLPVFGESRAIKMSKDSDTALDVKGELRLGLLNEALFKSKHKNKSTYTTWMTYFTQGAGARSEIVH